MILVLFKIFKWVWIHEVVSLQLKEEMAKIITKVLDDYPGSNSTTEQAWDFIQRNVSGRSDPGFSAVAPPCCCHWSHRLKNFINTQFHNLLCENKQNFHCKDKVEKVTVLLCQKTHWSLQNANGQDEESLKLLIWYFYLWREVSSADIEWWLFLHQPQGGLTHFFAIVLELIFICYN